MAKQMTNKQLEKHEQRIILQANIWLKKYSPQQVSLFIWNKYGYMAEAKNSTVYFKGHNGMIAVS